ncbi:MAG TPA: XdhC family protein [Candidatus Angelobacter sp.]|nr:XdhC family protein [Candidatus Angelobacter sp.]
MFEQFLKKSAELVGRGESFVVATVVRCQPPTSGKPGDKAIIRADGSLWGWIGGGCAQPVVIKEALQALSRGRAIMVRISPTEGDSGEGIVDYTMTCHSGGALDIYIEPVMPRPQILILGRSPVAQALARLARTIDYSVSVVAEKLSAEGFADATLREQPDFNLDQIKPSPQSFVVVSTQGEGDEEALENALRSDAAYVAFVASATKAAKIMDYLREKGMPATRLQQLRAPAGVNIRAASPPEIAVSILAEIIQTRAASAEKHTGVQPKPPQTLQVVVAEARDLVCGMTVDRTKAKYRSEYRGEYFYFCCGGCKQAFDKEPQKYLDRRQPTAI